ALRNDFTELGTFSRMAHLQVWVISNERVLISYHLGKQQLEFDEIPTRYTEMVDRVLLGHRVPNAQYRDVWNRNMFGVGTPIFGPDGQVLGAVLVQISNERVSGALQGVLRTLGVSVLIAAGLTLLLAARMSAGLSGPILRINRVAQRLSEGDYAARTEVVQHDELGALAETMDVLAVRLAQAKEESEQLETMRQNFIANISHELRTPVTVMRATLESLYDGMVSEPDEVAQSYRAMLDESIRLQQLINDLLDLSRLQTPEFQMNLSECSLCDIVEDVIRSLGPVAHAKDVRLIAQNDCGDRADCRLVTDYTRVRQMLMIFTDNAVKFTPPGKQVSVRIGYDGAWQVTVTDEGIGIPPEEQAMVFERFYRGRLTREIPGSGLGLSIARQIATRLGIGLVLESALGTGTAITVHF
ncbi:MAG: HAMP domain-containing sensor histidine kinase, partial [Oscillospiraceae bacterium]